MVKPAHHYVRSFYFYPPGGPVVSAHYYPFAESADSWPKSRNSSFWKALNNRTRLRPHPYHSLSLPRPSARKPISNTTQTDDGFLSRSRLGVANGANVLKRLLPACLYQQLHWFMCGRIIVRGERERERTLRHRGKEERP